MIESLSSSDTIANQTLAFREKTRLRVFLLVPVSWKSCYMLDLLECWGCFESGNNIDNIMRIISFDNTIQHCQAMTSVLPSFSKDSLQRKTLKRFGRDDQMILRLG